MDSYGLELFLSTPSARRATIQAALLLCADEDFYPRPPRGGRQPFLAHQRCGPNISIHALREEGDPPSRRRPCRRKRFLSTPSARRATALFGTSTMWPKYFYPRPPRGGRPTQSAASVPEKAISIHALREEGDLFSSTSTQMGRISIHALREEGDRAVSRMPSPYSRFLSTPSARRATQ